MMNREELIDLIEKRYFKVMDQGRLDDTLDCIAVDCVWHIYPAGTILSGRDGEIRDAFEGARVCDQRFEHPCRTKPRA